MTTARGLRVVRQAIANATTTRTTTKETDQ